MKALFIRKRGNMEIKEWRDVPVQTTVMLRPVLRPLNVMAKQGTMPDVFDVTHHTETYLLKDKLPDGTLVYVNEN